MNNLKYWNAGVTGIRAQEISSSHRQEGERAADSCHLTS